MFQFYLRLGQSLKQDIIPKIEDFFTEDNENHITPALVDCLVREVKANQLDKDKDIEQKVLIQLAKRSNCNWKPIPEWAKEVKVDFESIVPSMSVVDLEKMVKVGQDGIWERETVHHLLCKEDDEGANILSHMQLKTQPRRVTVT